MSSDGRERHGDSTPAGRASPGTDRDTPSASITKASKLNQVVQNFYMKAALIVIQARQSTSPVYTKAATKRLNRWFNIETVETDAFRDELRLWKTIDVSAPVMSEVPSLVVEVVLLTKDLTTNQTLVVVGKDGRRLDVEHGNSRHKQSVNTIVLERWQVRWEEAIADPAPDLPTTYKKSIVVFRSLYALTKLLPAWQLRKRLARSKLTGNSLKVVCQVAPDRSNMMASSRIDLHQPLVAGYDDSVENFKFHKVTTAAGRLCISVDYRQQCDFRIDDSEALLSSQFLTNDQIIANRPPSSLPSETSRRIYRQSSFTPLSSSNNSMPYMALAEYRPGSQSRIERRPSATLLQPFKSPSLSASPSLDQLAISSRSISRTPSSVSIDRINARTAGYPQSQRIPSSHGDSPSMLPNSPHAKVLPSAPQLIKRYSSSFGQRSGSFSGRRRSSQISETAVQFDASSMRSISRSPSAITNNSDEQDLGDFVNMLDNRKPLSGSQFRDDVLASSHYTSESMLPRSQLDLSRFHRLKESHANLSNSLLLVEPSRPPSESPTSPRQPTGATLASVALASASPGKSVSPHTPAIPSRLSESSVMPRPRSRISQPRNSPLPWNDQTMQSAERSGDLPDSSHFVAQAAGSAEACVPTDYERIHGSMGTKAHRAAQHRRPTSSRTRSDSSNSSSLRGIQHSIMESPVEGPENRQPSADHSTQEPGMRDNISASEASPIPASGPEDEDLFFAMSDIHFGSTKPNIA